MGKLIYDEREGYDFISDNGITYTLLEGKSLGGRTTSDILFIMLGYDEPLFDSFEGIEEFVGWFYGATLLLDMKYRDEYKEYIEEAVKRYEDNHPEIVNFFKSENEYEICFEKYGKYIVKAKDEKEAWEKASCMHDESKIDWNNEFIPTVITERE